jgi:hypothetical protein
VSANVGPPGSGASELGQGPAPAAGQPGGPGVQINTLNDNSGKSVANAAKTQQFNAGTPNGTTLRRFGV